VVSGARWSDARERNWLGEKEGALFVVCSENVLEEEKIHSTVCFPSNGSDLVDYKAEKNSS
jgi:hypothetical protein